MNNVQLIGRLTRDPDVRYTQGENSFAVARFVLAVDRRYKKDGEQTADFITCVAFGKNAEFFEKYGKQGMKFGITGRIQTGKYEDKDGKTVYTTDVVVETQEFCEKKNGNTETQKIDNDGFMTIPEGIEEGLPFN